MLKWTIISLRWQWYLSGRTTSVHWSKNCCGSASVRKADPQSAHHTAASIPLDGRCHWCDISQLLLLLLLSSSVAVSSDWRSAIYWVQCTEYFFTARRYALAVYAMALCPSVCSSQVAAQPITVVCKATRVYIPILGRVVWTFYRVLYKNGWTNRPQSPKPTLIHAKCKVVLQYAASNSKLLTENRRFLYFTYEIHLLMWSLSLIHIWRCRRSTLCRSRWSPYH